MGPGTQKRRKNKKDAGFSPFGAGYPSQDMRSTMERSQSMLEAKVLPDSLSNAFQAQSLASVITM